MKLPTRGRYAVRALVDVAMHCHETPVILRGVAERQDISLQYLQQIFVRLGAAGLVKGTRGAKGGFTLAKPASQTKLSDIVQALEGSIAPVKCVDDPATCERVNSCAARDIWVEMGTAARKVLESVTLEDLVERQRQKERPEATIYHV